MELLDRLLSIKDLDEVVDFLSFELKRPIIVESADYVLLAYNSYYINHYDEANQQTIFTKKWTLPIYERFVEAGVVHNLKTKMKPFYVEQMEDIGLNPRVVVSARHQNRIMGYVWVQCLAQELTEDELALFQETSHHIGKLIYEIQKSKLKAEEKEERFYRNLFDYLYKTDADIEWGAKEFGVRLPEVFTVMAVELLKEDKQLLQDLQAVAQTSLQLKDRLHHVLIRNQSLIVITGGRTKEAKTAELAAEILTKLHEYTNDRIAVIAAGIGNTYEKPLDLLTSWMQAEEVIKAVRITNNRLEIPVRFSEMGIFRYLPVIYERNQQLGYVNERLAALQQKDKNGKKELLRTLEVYLLNNCKLKTTAARLFVHPNTVNYRLQQINDIIEVDLQDIIQRTQLLLDILTLEKKL